MASNEFDEYADTYRDEIVKSISFVTKDHEFFTVVKARDLLETAAKNIGPAKGLKLLDVGCGVGETDRFLIPEVGELHGVDMSEESIERAKRDNPAGNYLAYGGRTLPYDDGQFDLAFAICVFHHVPPAQWKSLAAEMRRVVRPGGLVVIYEHNPWNPLTRMVVNRCEFDKDAVLLSRPTARGLLRAAGMSIVGSRDILFVPFGGTLVRAAERAISWIPLGAQYTVAGRV